MLETDVRLVVRSGEVHYQDREYAAGLCQLRDSLICNINHSGRNTVTTLPFFR